MVAKLEEKGIEKSHPVVWLNLALALGWNDCSVDWVLSSVLKQDFVDNIQSKFAYYMILIERIEIFTIIIIIQSYVTIKTIKIDQYCI